MFIETKMCIQMEDKGSSPPDTLFFVLHYACMKPLVLLVKRMHGSLEDHLSTQPMHHKNYIKTLRSLPVHNAKEK